MYLSHHGIKGQKWGVRRFQNPDGSLTAEGRERYGITNETSDSFTLKKGSALYRVANEDEQLAPGKEHYYSLLEEDRSVYSGELMGGLFADMNKPIGEFMNTAEKDITVKKGERVLSDLIQKYGNESAESLTNDYNKEMELRRRISNKEDRSMYYVDDLDDWEEQLEFDMAHDRLKDFVWDLMKDHGDKVISDFKNEGYDAIIDPFDYLANIADMPIIVLDAHDSVKQRAFRKIAD